ncbi:WAT1-related protein [Zea mays]|uniref:WAT1-related protein n=1 Tax=Zea mays TaxID=4577 RepID=A0A317Y504_MAIZE|nr:WAT1-related protein [Zea mays]
MDAKKPYMLAITTVAIYTGMYVVSKAAFNQGMNSFVFVFYRQAAASLLLLPIALVLERNTLGMNLCNASVTLTSATVASATGNSTPVITFCLALLLRMEVVKLRSVSGIAKVTGVALCLAGALVIALYTGPSLSPVNRHHRASGGAHGFKAPTRGGTWVTGTFLMLLSNVTWSLWTVLQGALLKEYPNKLLVTTSQCLFSTAQSFVVAAVAERDFSKWALKLDVSLIAVAYTIKGPVFLAVWNPLCFVLTIFCSSFFLGENVHLGSIVGGILLVCGLYSVLWGKTLEVHQTVESGDNTVGEVQNGQEEKNHQQKVLEKGRQEEASMTAPGVV